MQHKSAHDYALEYGAMERGEGTWTQVFIAACLIGTKPGQVPFAQFMTWASVGPLTIKNHLEGYDKAAVAKLVPARDTLTPDMIGTIELPAMPFNGPGGFVKTRKGGANSTDAVMDKIKTKSGAYASRLANDPAVLAALLETAEPAALTAAMSQVNRVTIHALSRTAATERLAQVELDVMAGGGKVPTLDEVNGGAGNELDGMAARMAEWSTVASALDGAIEQARKYGEVGTDSFEAGFLRDRAMRLVDLILAGSDVAVQS